MKTFTTTGVCTKENNYMVDITDRLIKMKAMVDAGNYFTVTRGRQYGKTTTLTALAKYLKNEYVVLNLDFQNLDDGSFENGSIFTQALSQLMIDEYEFGGAEIPQNYIDAFEELCEKETAKVRMADIFRIYKRWCRDSDKPIVLMIDEVDSATNNQVFLDFLALLREGFLARTSKGVPTFRSVILAGVTDIKSLKRKIRPDEAHKFNSPWNIAADFNIDMSLPVEGIVGMLDEYCQLRALWECSMNMKTITTQAWILRRWLRRFMITQAVIRSLSAASARSSTLSLICGRSAE